jgi:type I site-specific restriction endonuclease
MPRQISEELTRKEMIDPQLEQAGWYLRDHSRVNIEIPLDGYDAEPWNGVSDYFFQHNYNADQIRSLRAVHGAFLQKRHLETADLYEPPLDMFGADAVKRWFTENEVKDVISFVEQLTL